MGLCVYRSRKCEGLSLIEMMVTLVIGALLMSGLVAAVSSGTERTNDSAARGALQRSGEFALDRISRRLRATTGVRMPMRDTHGSYLSIELDPTLDSDGDGVVDADNDRDGRVNEDPGEDLNNDTRNGILGVDEDGDGQVDETDVSGASNDDEDDAANEDPLNGVDDDGDGRIDEDFGADANGDGCPGLCSVDDDLDGSVDEGAAADDDEDGSVDEDWIDTVDYFLQGADLVESVSPSGAANGAIRTQRVLASNVTSFLVYAEAGAGSGTLWRVELVLDDGRHSVDLTAEVANP